MANRDLKHTTRSPAPRGRSTASKSSGGGMMVGVVIGLIVGIAVAVGLAMYLNRSSTPFASSDKGGQKNAQTTPPAEVLAPGTKIADATPAPAQPAATPAPAAVESRPVTAPLPTPAAPPSVAATPAKPPVAAKPAAAAHAGKDDHRFDFYKILPGQVDAVPADSAATGRQKEPSAAAPAKRVYLQLGAFQNQDDADNLKAKLALLGVEAKIQSISVPDKGMVHRVRVGPLNRQDDVDRMRAQLRQDGVNAVVVKAE